MWRVVKEGPALETGARAEAGGAAWEVLRAAAAHAAAVKPRVQRVEVPAQDRPAVYPAPRPQPLRASASVRVTEAVVLVAVAVYFAAGVVGVLLS